MRRSTAWVVRRGEPARALPRHPWAAIAAALVAACGRPEAPRTPPEPTQPTEAAPRAAAPRLILFVGDGMGSAHVRGARLLRAGERGARLAGATERGAPPAGATGSEDELPALSFTGFTLRGVVETASFDDPVTDSAASATALATGVLTHNGAVGVGPSGERLRSVTDAARARGMAVGVITSVSLDHATPAAFYAHQPTRKDYAAIAGELAAAQLDFAGGGGLEAGPLGSPPFDALTKAGYRLVTEPDELFDGPGQRVVVVPRTPAPGASLPYAIDDPGAWPSLAELTRGALEALPPERGYFLMVEGGKIDWAGHENDAATAFREVLAFDEAVAAAVAALDPTRGESSIVVTADHETGGLTLPTGSDAAALVGRLQAQRASVGAIAAQLARAATRPTGIPWVLIERATGLVPSPTPGAAPWAVLTEDERALVDRGWRELCAEAARTDLAERLATDLVSMLAARGGVRFATRHHTAAPVPVYAEGPASERLASAASNADIGAALLEFIESR